jgi:uncharacterized protein YcbK (DUF882 family)
MDMTRYNRTEENVSGLRNIYNNAHISTAMEGKTKKSAEVYDAIDLDPSDIKKVDIRANY